MDLTHGPVMLDRISQPEGEVANETFFIGPSAPETQALKTYGLQAHISKVPMGC